jgi:metal-sulfur cluster biosynthetic enzyme
MSETAESVILETPAAEAAQPEANLPVVETPAASLHAHHHHGEGGCCSSGSDVAVATSCESAPKTELVTLDGLAPAAPVEAPDELTLLNALKQVVDPELFVNIVDLGLIYAIQQEDAKVNVDMTLTSPACPAGPQIVAQAKQALEAVPGVKEATIKLVMTPPWSPDRMTDDARDHLGIF